MSQKQFQQEIGKRLPHGLYLLSANNEFLLYDALSMIRSVFGAADPFAVEVFDLGFPEDCPPLPEVVDIMRTVPFFVSRKTVVLRNLQKLSKKDVPKIEDYLRSPASSTLLVMLHEGKSQKMLAPAALKNVKSISISIPEHEIPAWVQERARARAVDLTKQAVDELIGAVGKDFGLLQAELDKFQYAGVGGKVDEKTMREVVFAGAEYGAFDIINALNSGDMRETFRRYESVKRTAEPHKILGAFNWHYAKLGGSSGVSVMQLLHEADFAIKTSHQHVLENLLYRLARNR